MKSPQAILIGAALIALSILYVEGMRPAEAQRTGPFQLMHHSNTQANSSVFRLDTSTGEVTYCYISPDTRLVCLGER